MAGVGGGQLVEPLEKPQHVRTDAARGGPPQLLGQQEDAEAAHRTGARRRRGAPATASR